MQTHYRDPPYRDVGWPPNPTRVDFQHFIHVCEGKCTCSVPNFQPSCKRPNPDKPHPDKPPLPSLPPPSGARGQTWNPALLRVLTWNLQGYCSGTDNYRGITATLTANDAEPQAFDVLAFQEAERGAMVQVRAKLPYLHYYNPGHGLALAWNAYRFPDPEDYGWLRVAADQYGPRFVVYAVFRANRTENLSLLALCYHGCVGCHAEGFEASIAQLIATKSLQCHLLPVFMCDCNSWSDGRFRERLCFRAARLSASKLGTCGALDFIYFPENRLQLQGSVQSFGGSCGCSDPKCHEHCTLKDSDHSAVAATLKVLS
jgi:hypothetical protein